MKRTLYFVLSKILLYVGHVLWRTPWAWSFELHQKIHRLVINWSHKYHLNIFD